MCISILIKSLFKAIFLILLAVGMAYEWKKGDLEWARPKITEPTLEIIKSTEINKEELKTAS